MINAVNGNTGKLNFTKGNTKLSKDIAIFSLPAGWTCPGAMECLVKADPLTGKLTHGKEMKYRCYAANSENYHKNARNSRWRNLNLLKGKSREEMGAIILGSLPRNINKVRVHESGDFFSESYFLAWCDVANAVGPDFKFYAYTKSLNYWVKHRSSIPSNFTLTASRGGLFDTLIDEHNLNQCEVVFSEEEAMAKSLEIDFDDSHAYNGNKHFALLLNGMQPKGTEAKKALDVLKTKEKGSYYVISKTNPS